MSVDYTIEWSAEAVYDVAEIAEYIEERFGEARADRFTRELQASVGKLSYMPAAFGDSGFSYRGERI